MARLIPILGPLIMLASFGAKAGGSIDRVSPSFEPERSRVIPRACVRRPGPEVNSSGFELCRLCSIISTPMVGSRARIRTA